MPAGLFLFDQFAGVSRGLLARPRRPDNTDATRDNILSIAYAAHIEGNATPFLSGSLTVADVMFNTGQTWTVDDDGAYFIWAAPGTLWPDPNVLYRIIVTWTPVVVVPSVPAFKMVWRARTLSLTG